MRRREKENWKAGDGEFEIPDRERARNCKKKYI